MRNKVLFFNGRVHTQAASLVVDSMAVNRNQIMAVGNHLENDTDLRSYVRFDLNGRTVVPGFVDAHTHFYFYALSLGWVSLDGETSRDGCLKKIRKHASKLAKKDWVLGNGYTPDAFSRSADIDRLMLDSVCGGRPAFIFFKDTHSAWVNTKAMEISGISSSTTDPKDGRIERFPDGSPSGILREQSAYDPVYTMITPPTMARQRKLWGLTLGRAYQAGVTGVHSFDGPEAFEFFSGLAIRERLGLRINYYPPARKLSELSRAGVQYGDGDDFLRIAGVKLFADGALGSRTALCYNKYMGSRDNRGIEVTSVGEMTRLANAAARLKLPCAIHAIGDKAISNVLDALDRTRPLPAGIRHRIEHLQMIRRKDIARVRKLGVIASMQPSHCPSDTSMVRKYWGRRGRNAYIFRTLIDTGIDLAFGSDVPIEPLDPIAGIAAAVRRARPRSRDVFYPEQRISASEALYRFTVGPALACGQQHCRGYVLPGYPADYVILDQDITRVAPARIMDTKVLATFIEGEPKYAHSSLNI